MLIFNLEKKHQPNCRDSIEGWIKQPRLEYGFTNDGGAGQIALECHRFRSNEVRLCLSVTAYNLGNMWRPLALPKRIDKWSLTSLQQRLVKTG